MRGDRELLEAWRAGNQAAGEALFDRYFAALVRFFGNKVPRGVDDLVQQTLLGCLEGKQRLPSGAVKSYIFGVARNVLFDHFRRRHRDRVVDGEVHSVADLAQGPHSVLVRAAEHRVLLEALRHLPLREQIVLELYFWERLTAAEIGEALGSPEPSVRTWIRRAKQQLEQLIGQLTRDRALDSTHATLDQWAAAVRGALDGEAAVG